MIVGGGWGRNKKIPERYPVSSIPDLTLLVYFDFGLYIMKKYRAQWVNFDLPSPGESNDPAGDN